MYKTTSNKWYISLPTQAALIPIYFNRKVGRRKAAAQARIELGVYRLPRNTSLIPSQH
jgi:hypothetical protein